MSLGTVVILLVASNVGCSLLGFLLGRLTRATVAIEQEIEQHMSDEEDSPPPRPKRRITALQVIAGTVAMIGIMTVVMGVITTRNQDRLAGCVVGYSNATADALKASRAAQTEVNDRMDGFMQAVLQAFSSPPAEGRDLILKSVRDYVAAREEARTVQRQNPLPEAPRDACAELLD